MLLQPLELPDQNRGFQRGLSRLLLRLNGELTKKSPFAVPSIREGSHERVGDAELGRKQLDPLGVYQLGRVAYYRT